VSPLQDYLLLVRTLIETFPGAQVERYRAELLTASRANLRIRLLLPGDSVLEISEALLVEEGTLRWISYRYHCGIGDVASQFAFCCSCHEPVQSQDCPAQTPVLPSSPRTAGHGKESTTHGARVSRGSGLRPAGIRLIHATRSATILARHRDGVTGSPH